MSFIHIPRDIPQAEISRDKLRRACDILHEVVKELGDTPFYDGTGGIVEALDELEDYYDELNDNIRLWEGDGE